MNATPFRYMPFRRGMSVYETVKVLANNLMWHFLIPDGHDLAARLSPIAARNNREAVERWVLLRWAGPDAHVTAAGYGDLYTAFCRDLRIASGHPPALQRRESPRRTFDCHCHETA